MTRNILPEIALLGETLEKAQTLERTFKNTHHMISANNVRYRCYSMDPLMPHKMQNTAVLFVVFDPSDEQFFSKFKAWLAASNLELSKNNCILIGETKNDNYLSADKIRERLKAQNIKATYLPATTVPLVFNTIGHLSALLKLSYYKPNANANYPNPGFTSGEKMQMDAGEKLGQLGAFSYALILILLMPIIPPPLAVLAAIVFLTVIAAIVLILDKNLMSRVEQRKNKQQRHLKEVLEHLPKNTDSNANDAYPLSKIGLFNPNVANQDNEALPDCESNPRSYELIPSAV